MESTSIAGLVDELYHLAAALNDAAAWLQAQETERQRAAQQLADALMLNQAIIAASLVGIVAYDATGQCILANQAAANIIGATLEQVLAQNFNQLESWRRSGLLDAAQKALASGAAQRIETHVISTFGKALWLDCYFIPFTRAESCHLLLIFNDVTYRKQAEINLNALYAIASTTAHSLMLSEVLEQTLSTAIAFLEFDAGLVLLADAPGENLRLAATRNMPALLIERLQQDLEGTLCAHVYHSGESLFIGDTQGADVPPPIRHLVAQMAGLGWRAYAAAPLGYQKQTLGVLSLVARAPRPASSYDAALLTTIGHHVATAVAHARVLESAIKERSRLQALVMSSRDGIVLIGMDGRILVINGTALNLMHLPGRPEDWQGRPFLQALRALRRTAPAVLSAALAEMHRMRSGDEPFGEGEVEAPQAFRWVNLPVLMGKSPQGRLVILYDVSEVRAIERLREDMIHTLVHDLRNPLSNIATSLGILIEGVLGEIPPEQSQLLNIAQSSVNHMLTLVNAILDVSRLESRQMPLSWAAFDVREVTAETLRMQSVMAANKGISLENEVPLDLPQAWGDVDVIRRVLQNLTGNAIKFTPAGGRVRVTAQLEPGQRPTLLVSVSDTGPGIPQTVRERLFQKFVTGKQAGHGSGLGLAFCKLALEAHGQHIWVESAPGAGAVFTFTLATAG